VADEPGLVYLFAGLLVVGAVILLFIPLVRHVRLFSPSPFVSWLIALAILALAAGAIALVLLTIFNPLYSLPIVAVTVGLRMASPTLLYRKVKDRFEPSRWWASLRILAIIGFLGLAGFLLYELAVLFLEGPRLGPLALSEQLIMAVGASTLVVRFAFRALPKDRGGLVPVWLAAILFGVAFVVVAPYVFPEFAAAYLASGLVGWIIGAVAIRRDW
jgi:hypothetical protein